MFPDPSLGVVLSIYQLGLKPIVLCTKPVVDFYDSLCLLQKQVCLMRREEHLLTLLFPIFCSNDRGGIFTPGKRELPTEVAFVLLKEPTWLCPGSSFTSVETLVSHTGPQQFISQRIVRSKGGRGNTGAIYIYIYVYI